jgi:hypothetical protein
MESAEGSYDGDGHESPNVEQHFGDHELEPSNEEPEEEEDNQPAKVQDPETRLLLTPQEFLTLNNIHNCNFEHTKVFDPLLLEKTGMDEEFNTVFTTMGWENFWKLADHLESKILTLEFLSTVKPSKNHIYFRLMD